MDKKLNHHVEKMRSQMMSFSNDGMEVSLNIPDTEDVKQTFGACIETIVEQEEEISALNTTIEVMENKFKVEQSEMKDWADKKINELLVLNKNLESKLKESNNLIKNFSYNIQGYLDESLEDKIVQNESKILKKEISLSEVPNQSESILFPTEEGAELLSSKENNVNFKRTHSSEPSESFSYGETAAQRWKKAINKVIKNNRIQKQKIGMTHSRLEKNQTLIARLERLEDQIFRMPKEFEKYFEQKSNDTEKKFMEENRLIREEIAQLSAKLDENAEENKLNLEQSKKELDDSQKLMREAFEKEIIGLKDENTQVVNELNEMEKYVKEIIKLDIDSLKNGIEDIKKYLDNMDGEISSFEMDFKKIPVPKLDKNLGNLVELIKFNSETSALYTRVEKLQGSLFMLEKLYTTTKHDIYTVHHDYGEFTKDGRTSKIFTQFQGDQLLELVNQGKSIDGHLKHLKKIFQGCLSKCRSRQLEYDECWNFLQGVNKTMSKLVGYQSKVDENCTKIKQIESDYVSDSKLNDFKKNAKKEIETLNSKMDKLQEITQATFSVSSTRETDLEEVTEPEESSQRSARSMIKSYKKAISSISQLNESADVRDIVDQDSLQSQPSMISFNNLLDDTASDSRDMNPEDKDNNSLNFGLTQDANFQNGIDPTAQIQTHQASPTDDSPESIEEEQKQKPSRENLHGSFVGYHIRKSMQSTSSRNFGLFDPSPIMEDIGTIKSTTIDLQHKVDEVMNSKLDHDQVEDIVHSMLRNLRSSELKAHQAASLLSYEKSIKEISDELKSLRREYQKELKQVKIHMEETLNSSIHKTIEYIDESAKDSVINTRSLCIGCGRTSMVRKNPSSRPSSPSFLPTLSANSLPGPDVFRAGFKLPVRPYTQEYFQNLEDKIQYPGIEEGVIKSKDSSYLQGNDDSSYLVVGFEDERDFVPASSKLHRIQGSESDEHITKNQDIITLSPTITPRKIYSAPKTVRHAQGRPESEALRPIFKKGFPAGKKSIKMETTFAPERFEVQSSQPQLFLKAARIKSAPREKSLVNSYSTSKLG